MLSPTKDENYESERKRKERDPASFGVVFGVDGQPKQSEAVQQAQQNEGKKK